MTKIESRLESLETEITALRVGYCELLGLVNFILCNEITSEARVLFKNQMLEHSKKEVAGNG
jgi:hypothetical protein